MSVWPTNSRSSGKSATRMVICPLSGMSLPSYCSMMRGLTFAPLMSGAVSTWAMKPTTGAFSQPSDAGIVPIV